MSCCHCQKKRLRSNRVEVKEEVDVEEFDLEMVGEDRQSKGSTAVKSTSASKTDSEEDPDALSTFQVITAVVLLCLFALSFATSFFLLTTAIRSLDADFTDISYTCEVDRLVTDRNITCTGTKSESECIQVMLKCEEFNDTKIMYEFYQDYYNNKQCSATRCADPDKVYEDEESAPFKYPHSLIRKCCTVNGTTKGDRTPYPADAPEDSLYDNFPFISGDTFQYDRNKPEAIFYQRNDLGTNSLVLSPPVCYFIIVGPQVVMFIIAVLLLSLFIANKMSAKEIYRPVTTITPLHIQVDGKWYIKEVKPEEHKMNAFEKLRQANLEK